MPGLLFVHHNSSILATHGHHSNKWANIDSRCCWAEPTPPLLSFFSKLSSRLVSHPHPLSGPIYHPTLPIPNSLGVYHVLGCSLYWNLCEPNWLLCSFPFYPILDRSLHGTLLYSISAVYSIHSTYYIRLPNQCTTYYTRLTGHCATWLQDNLFMQSVPDLSLVKIASYTWPAF